LKNKLQEPGGGAVDGFVSSVSAALATGDKVTLVGFGTFTSRQGLNVKGAIPEPEQRLRFPPQKLSNSKQARFLVRKLNSEI